MCTMAIQRLHSSEESVGSSGNEGTGYFELSIFWMFRTTPRSSTRVANGLTPKPSLQPLISILTSGIRFWRLNGYQAAIPIREKMSHTQKDESWPGDVTQWCVACLASMTLGPLFIVRLLSDVSMRGHKTGQRPPCSFHGTTGTPCLLHIKESPFEALSMSWLTALVSIYWAPLPAGPAPRASFVLFLLRCEGGLFCRWDIKAHNDFLAKEQSLVSDEEGFIPRPSSLMFIQRPKTNKIVNRQKSEIIHFGQK